MPFDPTYPPTNALIESAPLRGNFNGLKDLIDAVPVINAAVIDNVTTLPPGDPATVGLLLSGATLHFTFGIPEGQTGPQGIPGEVTQAALDAAISGTSSNSNGVTHLSQSADSGYNQWQMQQVMDKVDELISALRRP
ncbi:MAG: hypothetical protein HS117_24475 [Verrucomicrobiaceae bacterium]|nr:hypothetical protein [Verrucomicrobiaceae bacterium]